jgi:hypothetical protein
VSERKFTTQISKHDQAKAMLPNATLIYTQNICQRQPKLKRGSQELKIRGVPERA